MVAFPEVTVTAPPKVRGADVVLEETVTPVERFTGIEIENPLTTLKVLLPDKVRLALAPVLLKLAVVIEAPAEKESGKLLALAVNVVTLTEFEKLKPVVLALESVSVPTPLMAPLMVPEVVVPQLSVRLLLPPVMGSARVKVPFVGTALVSMVMLAPSVMLPLLKLKLAFV